MAKRTMSCPHPEVNLYIGQRIRLRRDMMGLTQQQLAKACGVTFQQIQKYESGETRIVAERMYMLARVLDVPVAFLFSGLPNQMPASDYISLEQAGEGGVACAKSPDADDPLAKNESLELIKLYWGLSNDEMRLNIMNLLRGMKP